jgi:hypothetical protein
MVLASARLRGIHPPDNIQKGGRPGGECLSNAHWLGPWRQHFDDESWRGSGYSSRPSVYLILCHGVRILMTNHGVQGSGYAF